MFGSRGSVSSRLLAPIHVVVYTCSVYLTIQVLVYANVEPSVQVLSELEREAGGLPLEPPDAHVYMYDY